MHNLTKSLLATLMLIIGLTFSGSSFAWVDCSGLQGYKSGYGNWDHDKGQCLKFQSLYGNTDRDWVSKTTGIMRRANVEWDGVVRYKNSRRNSSANSYQAPARQVVKKINRAAMPQTKIQKVLTYLNFYQGDKDGTLNSFASRDAIEQFQEHYKLESTGVLNQAEKDDLLYMDDVLLNYKKIVEKFDKKNTKKANKLLKALDKLEKRISGRGNGKLHTQQYLSIKLRQKRKSKQAQLAKAEKARQVRLAMVEKARKVKAIKAEQMLLEKEEKRKKQLAKEKETAEQYVQKCKQPNNIMTKEYCIYDDIVLDLRTDIMWQRCSVGQTWNGATCEGEASKYNWDEAIQIGKDSTYASISDWHLPTIKELSTLVYCSNGKVRKFEDDDCTSDTRGSYQRPTINQILFPDTPADYFWSSSPDSYYLSNARRLLFGNGYDDDGHRSNSYRVRLVRSIE